VTDFDLVPTEDLLVALKRRFDHMVFAWSATPITPSPPSAG